jgi:L-amino acid N-acyltransferase YncA
LVDGRHVAEVRIVIDPAHRRQGVATRLARHAVITAVQSGIDKLFVNVVADETGTTAMFAALGFEAEGLLRNHVRGADGEVHDLLVLSHFVDEMVESMSAAGFGALEN